jgi:Peptidase inhibitor family I36
MGALAAIPSGAALASPSSAAAVNFVAKAESPAGSVFGCPVGYFCIYTGPNYTGTRYQTNQNVENLPSGIINADASFVDNDWDLYVRLYYGPDYGNPHTCIVTGQGVAEYANLLTPIHYYFNSNMTAGQTLYVYDDVHGLTIDSTVCTALMGKE